MQNLLLFISALFIPGGFIFLFGVYLIRKFHEFSETNNNKKDK